VKEEVDGYSIPLTGTQWLDVPLTLEDLRASKSVLHDAEAAVQVTRRGAVYFPFELSQRPVRPLQGYAFKLPAQFVAAFPNLARSAAAKRVIRRPWSDAELAACLDVYMQLLERQAKRDHPNYANVIRCLAVELGRTPGAVDRRLQAISLLLSERKDKTVSRFPPGQSLTPGIRHRLSHLYDERTPTADPDALDRLTKSARERGSSSSPPAGSSDPSSWEKQQTRRFKRRADIRAWVLNVANGTCEACGSAAPFTGKDGYPFLEVHHLRPLAEGGPDTSCNAAAVCPNCHRRLHSGADNEAYRMLVVDGVDRLVDHPARPM
jgi:5-methylcytosine-specific restriction protein A